MCADYVNANRGLPDYSSEPAAEGTAAHAVSDICLTVGMDADEFVGMPTRIGEHIFSWEEDDAMLLQPGLDTLRQSEGVMFSEHRVDISPWTLPGQFGTLDRAIITDDCITICDLKWGRGIPVSPINNKQIMLYALGFWDQVARHLTPAKRFRLIIDQPRHAGGGGVWDTSLDDLLKFGDWIRERAQATMATVTPRTASRTGCVWCRRRRAATGCDEFDQYMIGLLDLTWEQIDMGLPPELPRALTPERRSYLLLHRDGIKRWLDQLQDECLADALAGAPTGEMKAVPGNKTPDQWLDKGIIAAPVVEKILGEKGFTKKLKTPKQIETVIGDDVDALKLVAPFVKHGERKPTLVPLSDARAAIVSAQTQFDEEAGE